MRLINATEMEPLVGIDAEGVVRRRGFDLRVPGASLHVEQRTPLAVIAQTRQGRRRIDLPQQRSSGLSMLLPVAGYLAVRMWIRRRRQP